jgi:uncharacterized protein (TIGR03032 family)
MTETFKKPESSLTITHSRYFAAWLREQRISLACTTYQTCRLLLIGVKDDGRVGVFERLFDRAMGLFVVDSEQLWLSTRYQIWKLINMLDPGQRHQGCDRLYVPRVGYTTGDLDIHDLVVDRNGQVVFVSTQLNALATLSSAYSARPLWRPPFISRLVAEDRCHLNGLALRDGLARYVTGVGRSDVIDGWRDHRREGGWVLDLADGEFVAGGLSMPHSPRWYRDRLWLLNSGTGEFGTVDLAGGRFEPVAFCPGYARGLAFCGDYAVIGLSKPRDASFTGLELDERLAAQGVQPRCGLLVVDLNRGEITDWLYFEGVIGELYDVQTIPGVRRPMALGFKTDEIARMIRLEPLSGSGLGSLDDVPATAGGEARIVRIRAHDHAFADPPASLCEARYQECCRRPSDIHEHLPTLRRYADRCARVFELGTRSVVATWALLASTASEVYTLDIRFHPGLHEAEAAAAQAGKTFRYFTEDALAFDLPEVDLLFIDTLHTYRQLSLELARHAPRVGRYIILHDTETFGRRDEPLYDHASPIVREAGPGEKRGLVAAYRDFLETPEGLHWTVEAHYPNNNGLTVLRRMAAPEPAAG